MYKFLIRGLVVSVAFIAVLVFSLQSTVNQVFAKPTPPSINLSDTSSPAGSTITVSGTDFRGQPNVQIFFDDTLLITARKNGTSFTSSINIPQDASAGAHEIMVTDQPHDRTASEEFTVTTPVPNINGWPQYRFSPEQTGFNPNETVLNSLNVNNLTPAWNFQTAGGVISSPAVVDNTVFVGSEDGNVYAINKSTGIQLWSYHTNGGTNSSPLVADGKLYISSLDGFLYALNTTNGSLLWSVYIGNYADGASTNIANGVIYIGTQDGHVKAYDALNGNPKWSTTLGVETDSTPAISKGILYIGAVNGTIYALNATTGSIIWANQLNPSINAGDAPAVADGKVFVGVGSSMYSLDAGTGDILWSQPTGFVAFSAPSVGNGVVVLGTTTDHTIRAFNESSGSLLWSNTVTDEFNSSPSIANGIVYVGNRDGRLLAFDINSGEQLWFYQTGGVIFSSPAISDGMVFVGSQDRNLYAFHLP